jgi:membrane protease YdiL (CAAX protease family)
MHKDIALKIINMYLWKKIANLCFFELRLIDIYSAYRNLHFQTGSINKVEMNTESVPDLALSFLKWKYLKKKWVFIPVAVIGAVTLLEPSEGPSISKAKSITILGNRYNPSSAVLLLSSIHGFRYSFVATGEEMYWRGIIQTELTEAVNPTFAWILSSILFGLWHVPDGGWANGVGAAVVGGYLGYRYMNNGYDLGEVIALHFWIDWLPTVIEFIRNPKDGHFVFSIEWKL